MNSQHTSRRTARRTGTAVSVLATGALLALAAAPASAAGPGWEDVVEPSSVGWIDDFLPVDGDTAVARAGIYPGGDPGSGEVNSYWVRDGAAWTKLPKPKDLADDGVWAATAANDFWVAGKQYLKAPQVNHWNGSTWQNRAPADKTVQFLDLQAVSANDVWAVGTTDLAGAASLPAAAGHWNGSSWKVVKLPQTAGGATELTSVHVNSANDVWAAGRTCTDVAKKNCTGYAARWNGAAWNKATTPAVAGGFTDITVSPAGEVWIAGGTAVLRGDGTTWTRADVTAAGVEAVTELTWSKGKLHAGLDVAAGGATTVVRRDGAAWQPVADPVGKPNGYPHSGAVVNRLTATADGALWAHGNYTQLWSYPNFTAKLPATIAGR